MKKALRGLLARIRRRKRPDPRHPRLCDGRSDDTVALLIAAQELVDAFELVGSDEASTWATAAVDALEQMAGELFAQGPMPEAATSRKFFELLTTGDDPTTGLVAAHSRALENDRALAEAIRFAGAGVAAGIAQEQVRAELATAEHRAGHLAARRFRAAIAAQLDTVDPGARILAHDVPSLRGRIETTTTNRSTR